MVLKKRIFALFLVFVMAFAGVLSVSAAGSPTEGTTDGTYIDKDKEGHKDNVVTSKVEDGKAVVTKIEAVGDSKSAKAVKISTAYDSDGKKVEIKAINANVFNNKTGKKITKLEVVPESKITVKKQAFNKSKVNTIVLTLGKKKKVQFNGNAFKGTKATTVKIKIKAAKSSQIVAKKGAFKSLSKKSVITVGKKVMTKKEFKKLKKALKKAGFKGTVKRA